MSRDTKAHSVKTYHVLLTTYNSTCMFKNYLKVALRSLWKNKGFSAINIIGLAIGLAVCLLIVLYVVDELSYDKYNKNADRKDHKSSTFTYFNGIKFENV